MLGRIRKSGIDIIGDIPWGTHLRQFYNTKEDLLEIIAPYLKAGLQNNEYCVWIIAPPLKRGEAKESLQKSITDFNRFFKNKQIEIIPRDKWYAEDGAINSDTVHKHLVYKLDQALADGYDGVRLVSDVSWPKKDDR